jgi:hypothetical protein
MEYEVTGWLQVLATCNILTAILSEVAQLYNPFDRYCAHVNMQWEVREFLLHKSRFNAKSVPNCW